MKIAIDISPLENNSGHKVRGVGFYLQHLKNSLLKYFPNNEYSFFKNTRELPSTVDIIHYPYFDPFFLTLPLVKKCRTFVTVHDLTPLLFPQHFPSGIKGLLKWQIQKRLLKNMDGIITDSNSSKKDIMKITGINGERIHVVYLAAGEEFKKINMTQKEKQELLKKYHLPKKFVLYVGDVTWNKNLPSLINAIKLTSIPLVMVGKSLISNDYDISNPWNKDLVETQKLIKNGNQISTLGFVPTEDLVKLYNAATAFVMPSHYEGFGLPILEAMSCGCPVITSKHGSLPETAGEAAYYVDSNSSENIALGIKKVFEDEKLRQDLIQKGLVHVKKFSWEKAAGETLRAYETKN